MDIPHKTLIIRFSSIGDIVLSSPMVRALRNRFPDSQIDFLTKEEYADLVRFNPNLNVTVAYRTHEPLWPILKRLREERYDLVVDLHNSLRSRIVRSGIRARRIATVNKRAVRRFLLVHTKLNLYRSVVPVADRYIEPLRSFGVVPDGKGPELHIPDEILFSVSSRMAALRLDGYERVVGLCPSAKHATKRWPPERYSELGILLARESDAKLLVFGGEADTGLCSSVVRTINESAGADRAADLSGKFSLLETAAAMQFCDVLVTNDSGLMHIGTAVQKKMVAIFGSTVRELGFFPLGTECTVVEREGLYCRPCSHVGKARCPEGHFRCMLDITVGEVGERVRSILRAA